MSAPFLVTGLPRTRSAWLAVVATIDRSLCYHEPTSWLPRWQDVFDLWNASTHRYTGISDNALGFHLPEIIARIAPRVLIIERDIGEVEASLDEALGMGRLNYCALLQSALDYDHPLIMRIPYAYLKDDRTVAECLTHLMPDLAVDMVRIKELQRMNIQTDMSRVKRLAPHADLNALLGPEIASKLRAA